MVRDQYLQICVPVSIEYPVRVCSPTLFPPYFAYKTKWLVLPYIIHALDITHYRMCINIRQ